MKFTFVAAAAAGLVLASACSTDTPREHGDTGSTHSSVERAAPSGSLPIQPAYGDRTNPKNDGSTYEPCVGISSAIATRLGLDPSTISDLATIPRDPLRGCRWKNRRPVSDWSMTQSVTNWDSLVQYKQYQQGSRVRWRSDITHNGRVIGVYQERPDSNIPSCTTYVQSGRAGVITMVTNAFRPTSQFDECAKAIEATTAVIDQIPR